MRHLRVLLIVGLVLAVSSPAWATTIPFTQAWNGPIYMHVHDYTQGTTYDGKIWDGGSPGSWIPVWNGTNWYNQSSGAYTLGSSPVYDPYDATRPLSRLAYTKAGKVDASGNRIEDGWTVIQIDQIYKGRDDGYNTISPIDIPNPLYAVGPTQTIEIVATLFNAKDLGVKFENTSLTKFSFESAGDTFAIYAQPTGTFDQGAAGSSGRVISGGLYVDKYATIGFDSSGIAIPNSTLVLSGTGATGFWGTLAATERVGTFTVTGTSGTGDADEYFHATGGPLLPVFDTDFFVADKSGFGNADLRVHVTNSPIRQSGKFDWLVQSSDPLTASIVPEPATMAGLFLGIGFLGRYIRRRR